jgi:hypothetical protein
MDNKRKFERFPITLHATCNDTGNAMPQKCKIIELSREGMRLLLNGKIQFGETIAVRIIIPGCTEPVPVSVTVRWNKRVYDDPEYLYLAGGELGDSDPNSRKILFDFADAHWKQARLK